VITRSDRVAAHATGVGIGLITFIMVTWLVGAQLTEHLWGPPAAAIVAMVTAIIVEIATTIVAGRRLLRTVDSEATARASASTKDTTG
jgi:uncharacterized membrane protein